MTELDHELHSLVETMKGRATTQAEAEMGGSFDRRIEHTLDCLAAGERVIGLEDLFDNLYDYGIKITPTEHAQLLAFAASWAVRSTALSHLHELVSE